MKIGERIRAEREAQKLSRNQLCERTGMKYSTLAGMENGDQDSSTQLPAIADALGVSARWLQTGKPPKVLPASGSPSQSSGIDLGKVRDSVELLQYTLAASGKPPELVHDLDLLELAYRVVDEDGRSLAPAVKLDLNQKLAMRIREAEASYGNGRRTTEGTGGKAGGKNPGGRRRRAS